MSEPATNFPLYLFHHGTNFRTYETMGAHPAAQNRKKGYLFRVWAPAREKRFRGGRFQSVGTKTQTGWTSSSTERPSKLFIPGLRQFDTYKYCIETKDGRFLYKADPYAFHAETPGADSSNASKLYDLSGFRWTDREYSKNRSHKNI